MRGRRGERSGTRPGRSGGALVPRCCGGAGEIPGCQLRAGRGGPATSGRHRAPASFPLSARRRHGSILPRCVEPLGEAPAVPAAAPRGARGSGSAALLPSALRLRRSEARPLRGARRAAAIRHNGFGW